MNTRAETTHRPGGRRGAGQLAGRHDRPQPSPGARPGWVRLLDVAAALAVALLARTAAWRSRELALRAADASPAARGGGAR